MLKTESLPFTKRKRQPVLMVELTKSFLTVFRKVHKLV